MTDPSDVAEVPDADRQEQGLTVDPVDEDIAPPRRLTADPEAPEADAQEQALSAPLPDVDDFG